MENIDGTKAKYPGKTERKKALDIFRKNCAHDGNDEAVFRGDDQVFETKMAELLAERDGFEDVFEWEAHVAARVTGILNFCQYGDTSDADDLERIKRDLTERGLPGRCANL